MATIARPLPGEYLPYFDTYLRQLPAAETDLLALLRRQPAELAGLLAGVADDLGDQPTGPGKWSLKQILLHLIDTERVFAYRTLAVARGEQAALPSFDQDAYVAAVDLRDRTLADLLAEHAAQRAATVALLAHLPAAAHERGGTVGGHHPVTVRALAWITAAHELHHHRLLPGQLAGARVAAAA